MAENEVPKAITAIRSLLETFRTDGSIDSSRSAEFNDVIADWTPLDRYQLVAVSSVLVRWMALERGISENEVLDALVEENWPKPSS